ncbi:hypothetical protein DUG12_25040 [Salmonella enterica]|nr:hypothetical protein [Salmonella enterica]EBU8976597.1 hypothetical protein [Salmonella enterica subsp. enterica serovar Java]
MVGFVLVPVVFISDVVTKWWIVGACRLWRWEVLCGVSVPARAEARCKGGPYPPVHRAGGEQVMFLKEINTVI